VAVGGFRVAFLSANRETLPAPVIPLGLLYVLEATPERHERVLWDLCFQSDPECALAESLRAFRPDVVAIGLRNLQNNDYTGEEENLRDYARLVDVVRWTSDARIVLGGAGFSVAPEALMRRLRADFGVVGEGERAFPELLEALEGARPIEGVGGLLRWEEGALTANAPRVDLLDLDTLSPPDRSRVDDRYYALTGTDSAQSKRGCPLHCTYCTYPKIEGRSYRLRDPARFVDELWQIKEQRPEVEHLFVVDSTFNLPAGHASAICREWIDRGPRIPWTCYASPLRFAPDLAKLMAEAGCAGIEIGSDSGCDSVLARLKKGFDTKEIERAHEVTTQAGIKDCHTFVLGTPGETLDDARRSLEFLDTLDPFSAILMVWTDDEAIIDPSLATSRHRLREDVLALLDEPKWRKPRWVVPQRRRNFDPKLFRYLRGSRGLRGPLWQHLDAPKAPAPSQSLP